MASIVFFTTCASRLMQHCSKDVTAGGDNHMYLPSQLLCCKRYGIFNYKADIVCSTNTNFLLKQQSC